jgi:hypothetical protein
VVEVAAELALADHGLDVLVGCREHPDVHRHLLGAADPVVGDSVEHPQQLGLGLGVQLAHLVQVDGARVGQLEQALLVRLGPAERALLVPEQLALDKVVGERRAVDVHPRLGRPQRIVVQAPRHHLLPRPALTQDDDRRVGLGHALDPPQQVPHGRAGHDHGHAQEGLDKSG